MRAIKNRLFMNSYFIAVIVFFPIITTKGEVRSGFWTYIAPSGQDSIRSNIDFSVLTPFCQTMSGAQRCSLKVTDCYFRHDSIIAANGIYYDSSTSANLQSRFVSHKTININREALFYMDSMMKKTALTPPQMIIRNAIPAQSAVFFVRTSENRLAVMIKSGEYMGDIERTWYYWAYRDDNGEILYKNRLFDQPESLQITPKINSGQPDPVLVLRDSAAIAKITQALYVSVNTLLDSTRKPRDSLRCASRLGYRGFSVSGMFPEGPFSTEKPVIEICGGKILYYQSSATSSYQGLTDDNYQLEKYIIGVCCASGHFCDVFPDSLKPSMGTAGNRATHETDKPEIRCRVKSREVQFQTSFAGRARIECYGLSGVCLAAMERQKAEIGVFSIDLRDYSIGPGAYIIKFSMIEPKLKSLIFPVFIYH